jgi:hypothetical protein
MTFRAFLRQNQHELSPIGRAARFASSHPHAWYRPDFQSRFDGIHADLDLARSKWEAVMRARDDAETLGAIP